MDDPYVIAEARRYMTKPMGGERTAILCKPCSVLMAEHYKVRESETGAKKAVCSQCRRKRFCKPYFVQMVKQGKE